MTSLAQKKNAFTQQLILDAAIELIDSQETADFSLKRIAQQAGISERTMYRHFSTRGQLLNRLTQVLIEELELPPPPTSLTSLLEFPDRLFKQLDKKPELVLFTLESEFFPLIRTTNSQQRMDAIKNIIKSNFEHASVPEINMVSANIRYILSASTWRYYRFHFNLDLQSSIQYAQRVVKDSLAGLNKQ